MGELTNDEVAAVALAIKRALGLTGPLHPDESPWRRFDDAVARAAIDAYNATPSHVAMREEMAELTAERDRLKNELHIAEFALVSKGYRKSCDIPACNCGDQWNHGGHAMERLLEISDVLTENDVRRNGKTILQDVICVIRERDELREFVAAYDENCTCPFLRNSRDRLNKPSTKD